MAGDETLQAKVKFGTEEFDAGIDAIVAGLERLDNSSGKVSKDLAKHFKDTGDALQTISLDSIANRLEKATATMAASLTAVVNPATEFDAAMRNVNAIAKLSEAEFVNLSESLRTVGASLDIGVRPTEGAAAAYDILSAGIEGAANVQEVLKQSLIGSRAGLASTATAADALTTVLNGYGLKAEEAGRVNDVLFKTVERGKVTFEELASQIGDVIPAAAQNGVSLEELGASIALLTKNGTKAPQAVTAIRAAIVALGAPTEEAKKAAAQYGIALDGTQLKSLGLVGALKQVFTATNGNQAAIRKILGDVNGLSAAFNLAGDGGKKFAAELTAQQNAAGSAQAALNEQQKSFAAAQEKVAASFEAFKVKAGTALLPTLHVIADVLGAAVKFFEAIPTPILGMALALGGVATAGVGFVSAIVGVQASLGGLAKVMKTTESGATLLNSGLASKLATGAGVATRAIGGLGVVLGTAFLAMETGKLIVAGITAAQDALWESWTQGIATGKIFAELQGEINEGFQANAGVLNQTAQDIVNAGKGLEELGKALGGLRTQRQAALDSGDKRLVASLDILIGETQAKIDAIRSGAVKATTDAGKAFALLTGEAFDQKLHEIEVQKLADKDHLQALQNFLAQNNIVGAERRRVENEIANLKKRIHDTDTQAAKKAGEERFRQELQNVQHSKKGYDDQLKQLEALAVKYKDNGDKRRTIEDQISALKKKHADEEADLIKRTAELEANAAEQRQRASEGRIQDLTRQQDRGADVADQIAEEFRKQGEEQKAQIQAKLDEALADPKNAKVAVELKRQAKVDTDAVDTDTARKVQDLQDQDVQRKAQQAQEQIGIDKSITDAKLEALKREQAEGKNVNQQIENTILDRMNQEIASIQSRAAAEKAATDDVLRQKTLEKQAQVDIFNARQQAIQQLEEQNNLIEEQKRLTAPEKGPIKGGGGFDFTLGGISDASDLSSFSSSGTGGSFEQRKAATEKKRKQVLNRVLTGAGTSRDILTTIDAGGARTPATAVPKAAGVPAATSRTVGKGGAATAAASAVHVTFGKATAEVVVKTSEGKEIGRKTVPLPTGDGRGAPESKFGSKMSGRFGNNVRG